MAYWKGKGTTISIDATEITQVKSITPPAIEIGNVDVTHLTSTARENKATILDPGTASFTIEWDPADASHQALWTHFQADTNAAWVITIPGNSGVEEVEISFSGFMTSFGVNELTVDGVVEIPVNIQITGATTITYTAPA